MAARIAARLLRGKGPDVAFAAAASGNAAEGVSAGSEGAVGSASAASESGNPASGADVAAGEVIGAGEEAGEAEWGTYRDRRVAVRSFSGEARGEAVLDGTIFDVPVRRDIVHRVVLWQLAKRRQVRRRGVRGIGWEEEEYSVWGGGRRREGTRVGAERMEWVVNCIGTHSTKRACEVRGSSSKPHRLVLTLSLPTLSVHAPSPTRAGHAQHEARVRGAGVVQQAMEAEGHGARPTRVPPGAAVPGRSHHARPLATSPCQANAPTHSITPPPPPLTPPHQFRGGAAMHGPKPRSHAFSLNKKVRALGLKAALSARLREGQLVLYSDLDPGSPKTKDMAQHIATAFPESKKILFVDGSQRADETLLRASGNLHYVNVLPVVGMSVYSIVRHDALVVPPCLILPLHHVCPSTLPPESEREQHSAARDPRAIGLNVYSIVQHDALVLSLPALQALEHRLLSAKRQVRPGLEEKLCAAATATA
ncbi:unnamed protein product [Closterium sp. NIES-65]|nr:unnamed protein product [Closterium sp. NIES-65]